MSRNALTTAVNRASAGRIRAGLPRVRVSIFAAAQLKMPLRAAMETIIIIEISRNITLKSI